MKPSDASRSNFSHAAFTAEEVKRFRDETQGCAHVVHLNNAGAGLMPDIVTKSIIDHVHLEAQIGGYEAAALRATVIQEFYSMASRLLNCKPSEVAFTSSATDSFTRALSSIPFEAGDIILTDNDDFISNQIQFLSCAKRFGTKIVRIKNANAGGVDLLDLEEKLSSLRPRLLAITHIPTNSGLVQPVEQIAEIYQRHSAKHPDHTWYILDACQSVGQMKLDVQVLRCDFLSVTSRKFLRGPRGAGFLYISERALSRGLEPLFIDMRGAEWLERDVYRQQQTAMRFEDWEFAYALVIGTARAIEYCLGIGEEKIHRQVQLLSGTLRQYLAKNEKVTVLDRGPSLGGLVTFTVRGGDPQHLVAELSRRKINVVASYRKVAVIDFDEKGVGWAVRASPHYYNTFEEIAEFAGVMNEIVR